MHELKSAGQGVGASLQNAIGRDAPPSLRNTADAVFNQADQLLNLASSTEYKLFGDNPTAMDATRPRQFVPDTTAGVLEDAQARLSQAIQTLQRIQNSL